MRVLNFSAGPSGLPISVLQKAQKELLDYKGKGFSIMEISHRSAVFDEVIEGAKAKLQKIYGFDDSFAVLFLMGGASLQFAQVPMNLYNGGVAEYANTGVWTKKAINEAKILGINYKVVASSEAENFSYIPDFSFSDTADYGYICSNNTIYGTQYSKLPTCKCPLIVDSSSDLLSRPIDFKNIGLFYGGIQKNAGPAGVTLLIIKKDLANRVKDNIPNILRYKTQIEANSMSNTPNTFGIYMFDLMLDWINEQGGLKAIDEKNRQKAALLYDYIDNSNFYKAHAKIGSRSLMNVSFNIYKNGKNNENLEKALVEFSAKNNIIGLKGHRILGGLRASIYNAVSLENVKFLISILEKFKTKNYR